MGSVNERTTEIGVFRAIGFRNSHIMRIILLEAALVSLLAGFLGYAVGMGGAKLALPFMAESKNANLIWDTTVAFGSIGLALTLGLLASHYPTERLDFSLELPFVYQSSSAVVSGQFMGMQGQSVGTQSVMAAMSGSTMGSGPMTSASAGEVNNSQYGLGDVKLRAGYVLYTEEKYVPAIRPNFYVKIPTADKNKFLGTGAFDEGFAVELTK